MCPWWVRWYHRRLRRIDQRMLWPALLDAAREQLGQQGVEATDIQIELYAIRAWMAFVQQPGQAHWQCMCARLDDGL